MHTFLKIKIKSLAAEARIIRLEEQRLIGHKVRLGHNPKAPRVRGDGQLPWLRAHQGNLDAVEAVEGRYRQLRSHRVHDVRREARAAQLAYGLLRERPYARVEAAGSKPPTPVAGRLIDMVAKYGDCSKASAERQVTRWLANEA